MKSATQTEIVNTMIKAAQEHEKGEHPTIVPKTAKFINGFYRWEDETASWSWMPGTLMFSAWSKDIYISRRM